MKIALRIVQVLIALLVTCIVAACIYAVTFDPNDHKDFITRKVREQTGRELVMDGPLGLTIYPWLGISATNVSLSDDPAYSNEPFLTVGTLEARIKLLPLLSGDYEIDTVRLHDTQLNLITNANGRGNWESLSQDSSGEEAEEESSDEAFVMPRIVIGGIDIQNINVSYADGQAQQRYTMENMSFTTDALVLGEPLSLNMSALVTATEPELRTDLDMTGTLTYDLSGQAYSLSPFALNAQLNGPSIPGGSAPLTLTADIATDLNEETLAVSDLNLSFLDTTLEANLNGEDIQDEPVLSGNLNIQGNNLARVFSALGQDALAQQITASGSQSINVTTAFTFDTGEGELNVPELEAALLGATISGNVAANKLNSDSPRVSGALTAQGPDLPALLQLAGKLQGNDSSLLTYGESLRSYPGSKRFSVETRFDANPSEGDVQLPSLSINTLGIVVNGNLNASNMNSNSGSATGALTLTGSNMKPLLRALNQPDLGEVLDALSLDITVDGNRDALAISPLKLTMNFSGADIPNGAATLILNADSDLSLDKETLNISNFTLAGLGLNASGNVLVNDLMDTPDMAGTLSIPAFNLRQFLNSINQAVPVTSDETTLQAVALQTGFEFDDGVFALEELQATLDQSTLTGEFSADTGDSGAIRFNLTLDTINIDRYLAPTSETATPAQTSAEAELPIETLRDLDVNGTVEIGNVVVSKLTMSDIQATIAANDGVINLNPLSANLYEGSYAGNIRLDVSGNTPNATVGTELTTVNLAPLMTDYMGSTFVSGKGNISLNLSGSGDNTAAIRESLNGMGSIALEDGVLTGVDVGSVLTQVETMIRNRRTNSIDRGQQTPFDSFASTFQINNGVIATNDLLIGSPGFKVSGRGTLVDLRSEEINFQMVASVDETTVTNESEEYDLGGYSLPIACSGIVTSPRCLPDIAEIMRTALTQEVQRQLGGFLQRALGGDEEEEAAPAGDGGPAEPQ